MRWSAILEALSFVALILVYIWVVQPTARHDVRSPFLALLVMFPLASHLLRRERARDLGFRVDNVRPSAREVGLVSLAGAAAILAVGAAAGTGPATALRELRFERLLTYPVWALVQQYALQSFTYRRLRLGLAHPGAAALAGGLLFGVVHYPNVTLMGATAVAGTAWCIFFGRNANLFTIAVSHGFLATLVRAAFPETWLHGMRVGPRYWEWTP